MTKHDLNNYSYIEAKNNGDRCEWMACAFYGVTREKHDSKSYDVASDIEISNKNISVKSNTATLISGSLCRGCHSFHGIWCRYRWRTHSNTFVYVTLTNYAYEMNIDEFSKFVHMFGYLTNEAQSRGGDLKIRLRAETKKMYDWLDSMAA